MQWFTCFPDKESFQETAVEFLDRFSEEEKGITGMNLAERAEYETGKMIILYTNEVSDTLKD